MSKPSPLSRSNSSESLVESSSQKTPTKDEQSKSTAPPVMKNKKNAQREAYKASANVSSSSSSTYTKKNHDIVKSFKTEIDTARQTNEIKLQEKFSKRIGLGSVLNVNGLGEKEIQDLADWLSSTVSTKVNGLELRREGDPFGEIDYKVAKALAKLIQTNSTLTSLAFSGSWIDNTTAKCFAEAIQANPKTKITIIDLSCNLIDDQGAEALAEMLKTNTTITTLHLDWNEISAEGDKAIHQAIKGNPSSKITKLEL